ncbi:acyltransferase [Lachnospiraceae bacterium 62-26]|jgi:Acetyltransferase (isoleucine patch superfamily)
MKIPISRVLDKLKRELYRLYHPKLWNKRLQLNGIPTISGMSNLKLGHDVSINDNCFIQCNLNGEVSIGDRVTLSRGVTILTKGLDTSDYIINSQKKYRDHITKKVKIGDGTWIAANVVICPGVEIAEECIVAAGAIVSSSLLKPRSLYAGIPAKYMKSLE